MQLTVLDFTSIQLVLLPLYLGVISTVFFTHFFKRKTVELGSSSIAKDHRPLYEWSTLSPLAVFFLLVAVGTLLSVRGFEGLFCLSQLKLTQRAIKVSLLVIATMFVNIALLSHSNEKTTQPYFLEKIATII